MGGFPHRVSGDMAWRPNELKQESLYTTTLSASHIAELEQAIDDFKDLGLDGDCISQENFRLPRIQQLLKEITTDVHYGRGFGVLRGLDPSRYSAEDNMLIFLGLSSYVGNRRGRQSLDGEMITHVTDSAQSTLQQHKRRLVHSHLEINFHTDVLCDILAIQTRSCAAEGGQSYISPVWTIYNIISAQRPDIIDTLARPDWPVFDATQQPPFQLRPVLFNKDGRVIMSLSELHVKMDTPFRRANNIPTLTKAQTEALDVVLSTARKCRLQIDSRPGDIRFMNNLSLLHARGAYRDELQSTRHLVRLYLRNDEHGWEIPHALEGTWDSVYAPDSRVEEIYPIEPTPVTFAPMYRFGN